MDEGRRPRAGGGLEEGAQDRQSPERALHLGPLDLGAAKRPQRRVRGDEGGWAGPAEPIPAPGALLLSASHHRRACSLKPSKTDANKNEENDLLRLFILSASSGVLFFFPLPQSSLQ